MCNQTELLVTLISLNLFYPFTILVMAGLSRDCRNEKILDKVFASVIGLVFINIFIFGGRIYFYCSPRSLTSLFTHLIFIGFCIYGIFAYIITYKEEIKDDQESAVIVIMSIVSIAIVLGFGCFWLVAKWGNIILKLV